MIYIFLFLGGEDEEEEEEDGEEEEEANGEGTIEGTIDLIVSNAPPLKRTLKRTHTKIMPMNMQKFPRYCRLCMSTISVFMIEASPPKLSASICASNSAILSLFSSIRLSIFFFTSVIDSVDRSTPLFILNMSDCIPCI